MDALSDFLPIARNPAALKFGLILGRRVYYHKILSKKQCVFFSLLFEKTFDVC
jgi:hypothetical protein